MRITAIAASALVLGLSAGPAFAADNGIYLGASVGQSSVSFEDTIAGEDLSFDVDSTGFKAIVGWRFLDWLAVEGELRRPRLRRRRVAGKKIETDVDGISLSAVGFLPVGPVDLFARVGAIDWNADVDVHQISTSRRATTARTSPMASARSSASGAWACAPSTSASISPTPTRST